MNKKIILLFLLIGILFADYYIPYAKLDYYLNRDGTVKVVEHITYSLGTKDDGSSYRELYIRLPPDMEIEQASGYCSNHNCYFYEQMNEGWHELVLRDRFRNERVTATFSFIAKDQILEQKDCAQFFYKLWGEFWEVGVDKLEVTIHFPGKSKEVTFFLHPIKQYEVKGDSNSITIIDEYHPAETYLEINAVMPKEWFSSLTRAKNYMSKDEIIEGEINYETTEKLINTIVNILVIIVLLIPIISFIILYLLFGREKSLIELNYIAEYEREIDISPAEAGKVDESRLNPNYISAEIIYLTYKKYLEIIGEDKNNVRFRIINKNIEDLKPHQKYLMEFLMRLGDEFSSKDLERALRRDYLFYKRYYNLIPEHLNIDKKANHLYYGILILDTIIAMLLLFIRETSATVIGMMLVFFETIIGSVIVKANERVLGKLDDKSRVLEAKVRNFKKFLSDYTLLKEKAPSDVKIWEEYLAYATAFGVAKNVIKVMKLVAPQVAENSYLYRNYTSFVIINSSINRGYRTYVSRTSGRSSGGFGGGFGGGGGGGGAR